MARLIFNVPPHNYVKIFADNNVVLSNPSHLTNHKAEKELASNAETIKAKFSLVRALVRAHSTYSRVRQHLTIIV